MAPESELPLLAPLAAVRDPRPGEMIGEYRVESLLGEGGMATVFAAVHPLISKRAAIKVLSKRLCADPHAVERFLQEARTVNQIGHPNIVDVFAFGTLPDGRSYFVMEWLPGETLAARLLRGPLDFQTSLEVLCQVCEALEAAHEKRIIHRDLKPDNVYLVDGRAQAAPAVKLLDFGIAKLVDSDVTVPRTRSGVTMGTAGYMSPEQARGRALDDRTDVYALGAMAYEMLLGRLPFVGESGIDILALHLTEPPPSPRELWPEIPPVLERLLLAMLEKSAADRPSIAHVRTELTRLRGIEVTPRPKRLGGSRARARLLGLAALVALGAVATFTALRPARAPAPASEAAPSPPLSSPKIAPVKISAPKIAAPATSLAPAPAQAAATLIVKVGLPDATIALDGRRIAEHAPEARIAIANPGAHQVEVTAPGRLRFSRQVFVGGGATVELPVHLAPARAVRHPPASAPAPSGDYTIDPFK